MPFRKDSALSGSDSSDDEVPPKEQDEGMDVDTGILLIFILQE